MLTDDQGTRMASETPIETEKTVQDELENPDYKGERRPEAMLHDADAFPPGYWRSPYFIGSFCAVGIGFAGGTGGFALPAPLLNDINADIGPDPNIAWVSIANLLCNAVVFMASGRLTDIFGRRWFFIFGSALAVVGCIIGATAESVPTVIGAEVFIGCAAGFQISFFWVISEIVPMNRRMLANAAMYIFSTPTNTLAPLVSYAFQDQMRVRWRGTFWFMAALNVLSLFCWYTFYHPPTFKMLHRTRTVKSILLGFDWTGLFLFSGGFLLFLMGLSWGGSLYPWKSAHVIATILVGLGMLVALLFWEFNCRLEETYIPTHLMKNLRFLNAAFLTSIASMDYYTFSLIWPAAVAKLYTGLSHQRSRTLSSLVPMCFVLGQVLGAFIANWVHPKKILVVTATSGAALIASLAADPLNMNLTMGLLIVGCFLVGMMDGVAIAMSTFPLRLQEELGTAGGMSGAIRSTGSSIATVVYGTILANRLSKLLPSMVGIASTEAGLPASSVTSLISALDTGGPINLDTVPGISDQILDIAQLAYRQANARAYKTVFLSTLGFGGLGAILAWFAVGVPAGQENLVAGHIHRPTDEEALEQED